MLKDANDHFIHFKSCNQAIQEFDELNMTLKKVRSNISGGASSEKVVRLRGGYIFWG